MRAYLAGEVTRPLLRIARILREQGWQTTFGPASTCAEGPYDLIVLYHKGPDSVMRSRIADLRRQVDHEMLLLLSDRSGAGSLGADDVIGWASPATLADRLVRLLRQRLDGYQDLYQIGDLTVDLSQRSVRRNGRIVLLSQREFQLLILLVGNAGAPLPRSAIIERLWHGDLGISDNAVDALASRLRRRLDGPFAARMLQTVRGVGYCLAVPETLQLTG